MSDRQRRLARLETHIRPPVPPDIQELAGRMAAEDGWYTADELIAEALKIARYGDTPEVIAAGIAADVGCTAADVLAEVQEIERRYT